MPTIELHGFTGGELERATKAVIRIAKATPFNDEIVIVDTSTRVHDLGGRPRPFLRILTRSPHRAKTLRGALHAQFDVEVELLDYFAPAGQQSPTFADRLVEGLQPIRMMALAHAIFAGQEVGLFDLLASDPGEERPLPWLASTLNVDASRLSGLVTYLVGEGFICEGDDGITPTPKLLDHHDFEPWYTMLVGGYSKTFRDLPSAIRTGEYSDREGALVGRGSCGISQYDALPLASRLISRIEHRVRTLIDLGCGNGDFARSLLDLGVAQNAVGVDPHAPVEDSDETIRFFRSGAGEFVRRADGHEGGPFLALAAFMLQELLEQEGRDAVLWLVRNTLDRWGRMLVIEVEWDPSPALISTGLGQAYYNPYYLLHEVTEQRLETRDFWRKLFEEAGASIDGWLTVDPEVDPTGLEFGCLLSGSAVG